MRAINFFNTNFHIQSLVTKSTCKPQCCTYETHGFGVMVFSSSHPNSENTSCPLCFANQNIGVFFALNLDFEHAKNFKVVKKRFT